jgi:serine/threonine-protein kinase
MGEVFLAEDTRLHRRVALKRLNAGNLSGPEERGRILREARTVARLHHPGIASIFDVVEDAGNVWIVMEYVEGQTLAARLKDGPLPLEQALDLGAQIADALNDAHSHGVLHCDLKPPNVHLTGNGRAKILDFGLSQLSSAAIASEDTRIVSVDGSTGSAGLSGSPGYMAPERLAGTAPDERGDIYAMGVMLFEMLTGRRPFGGLNLIAVAAAALTTPPPSPSSIDPGIPSAVSAVVVKALSREPAERFQSARELAEALRSVAGGPATVTMRAGGGINARRSKWKHPVIAAATVVALASTVAVFSGWRPARNGAPGGAAPTIVVKPFANLVRDTANDALGVGITDDLTSKLAALPNVVVVSRDTAAAYVAANPASPTMARDLGASFVVDGGFERRGDQLRVTVTLMSADGRAAWTHGYERPLPQLFALQRDMAEGLADGLNLSLTRQERGLLASESTRNVNALADYSQGRLFLDRRDQAGNIDHAIEAFDRAIAADPSFALAHAGLGAAYWEKYLSTRDAAWTARAITSSLEALRLNANLAEVQVSLGTIYAGLGQTATAMDALNKALATQPNSDTAHRSLGDIFAKEGRTDDAVREYQRAIAIRPNYFQNYNRLAATFMKTGRYADAEATYRRITELQPDSSVGFNNLGVVKMMQDDLEAGLASLTRAADITPKASTFSNIGTIHYWNGRFDDARTAYEKAIALSPNDPSLSRNLGDAFAGMKNVPKAKEAWLHGLELALTQWRVNPKDPATLSLMAILEAKLNRKADARSHINEARALAPADSEVYYRSAVVAALAGERDQALTDLQGAVTAGYSRRIAGRDLDLRVLHDLAGYAAVIDDKHR